MTPAVDLSEADNELLYAVLYRTKDGKVRLTSTVWKSWEEADKEAAQITGTFKAISCVIGFTSPAWTAELDAPADGAGSGLIV